MELILKGLLGAAIAICFTLLGREGKGELAGLLAPFPIFSTLGYFLVGGSGDLATLKETARASVIGLPVLAAFFLSTWGLLHVMNWRVAIIASLVVWALLAFIWVRYIL